jgi:hypothetical protein
MLQYKILRAINFPTTMLYLQYAQWTRTFSKMTRKERGLTMLYNVRAYWDFVLWILDIVRYFKQYDLSETGCFRLQVIGWEKPTLLDVLDRSNFHVQSLRLAVSNGRNKLSMTYLVIWGRKSIRFPRYIFIGLPENGKVQKSSNPELK